MLGKLLAVTSVGKHPSPRTKVVPGDAKLSVALSCKTATVPLRLRQTPKAKCSTCFLPPPLRVFRALIHVAGVDARAIRPFMSPGFKPGLKRDEDLGTPDNLKWFFTPATFSENIDPFKSRQHTGTEGSELRAGRSAKGRTENLSAAGGDAWMFAQPVPGCVLLFALVPQGSGCTCYICTQLSAVA